MKMRRVKYFWTNAISRPISKQAMIAEKSHSYHIQRVSGKKLIFGSELVQYKPISIQISRHVLKETLNKTMQKVPTLPKTCATLENTSENFR